MLKATELPLEDTEATGKRAAHGFCQGSPTLLPTCTPFSSNPAATQGSALLRQCLKAQAFFEQSRAGWRQGPKAALSCLKRT